MKDHAIALARAFISPIVIMHNRGHIVPPLGNPHLACLRAFLTSIRDEGCPEPYKAKQRQQQAQAAAQDPLDPPLPQWETEAEQVAKLQQQKQQRIQEYQQQQHQRRQEAGVGGQQKGPQQQQQPEGRYVQYLKIDGEVGRVPQLAPKQLGSKL